MLAGLGGSRPREWWPWHCTTANTVRSQLEDCVFASRDLTRPVAKCRVPREGTLSRDAFQLVSDELVLDGNARQNLARF